MATHDTFSGALHHLLHVAYIFTLFFFEFLTTNISCKMILKCWTWSRVVKLDLINLFSLFMLLKLKLINILTEILKNLNITSKILRKNEKFRRNCNKRHQNLIISFHFCHYVQQCSANCRSCSY